MSFPFSAMYLMVALCCTRFSPSISTRGSCPKYNFPSVTNQHNTCTPGTAYNEFGYNAHPAITNRFVCIKIIKAKFKSSVTMSSDLQRAVSFASFYSLKGDLMLHVCWSIFHAKQGVNSSSKFKFQLKVLNEN